MKTKSNKKTILQLIVLVAIIVIGSAWIQSIKSGIEYADFPCPMCDSNEVLKLYSDNNVTDYECADCHTKFAIEEDF